MVSGATGQQGGAVASALLKDGHQVVGITRNPESSKSKALKERGAEMVSVDFNDSEKLVGVMQTVDTVFSLTTPFEAGIEAETQQGINMANAAEKANVGHFIFNSVSDANRNTGVPHFDSKYEVEKHLQSLTLNSTIVAPVYFMDNLMAFNKQEIIENGVLRMAMPANRRLQQIAVQDIGKVVAHAVDAREGVFGQRLNIAGDELTGEEAARAVSQVLGKEVRYEAFSPEVIRAQSEDMALMYEWFDSVGYSADLEALKAFNLLSFEQWLQQVDWN